MKPIYLSRRLAAKYVRDTFGLRCTEKWLAKLAVTGGGPHYWKDGRAVVYRSEALDAWAHKRITGPVSSSTDWQLRHNPDFSFLRTNTGLPFEDD
jgi:hypothetical protein